MQMVDFIDFPKTLSSQPRLEFTLQLSGSILNETRARFSEEQSEMTSRSASDRGCMEFFMWFEPLLVAEGGQCIIGTELEKQYRDFFT